MWNLYKNYNIFTKCFLRSKILNVCEKKNSYLGKRIICVLENILNHMMIFCKNAKSFKFSDKKSTELLKLSAFVISKFSQR